ncbi:MarR family transcriptional regulator [Cytobacillus sp. IB215316]|uniref:MarR family winged helix-turn-helix transcriptional regulator n=1 Tax=Cytobacillus sp. IB215316 TaxID=3097354 RepID=UPI002A15824B|nr:MarR family transcriptional regulator [Cytobacillus sp. IB215316]MDX8361981.1 MarR family transcriptional regulator [Cytobacillus sp. IB215316]
MGNNTYFKDAFMMLEQINNSLIHEIESLLQFDLTPKQSVLINIVQAFNNITVKDLAKKMNISTSGVSQLLSKLEKDKYIKREINVDNRREVHINLDTKGLELYQASKEIDNKIIDKYFSKLDESEAEQFYAIVKKLHGIVMSEKQNI